MIVALTVAFATIAVTPESTAIDRCRAAWKNLDAEGAIASCAQAGAAADTAKSDRVDGYRDLGLAFILQGRTDLAEDAFRSMLKIDPAATLGNDAGPTAQQALAHVASSMPQPAPPPAPAPSPAPVVPAAAPSSAPSIGHSVLPSVGGIALAGVGAIVAVGAVSVAIVNVEPSITSWHKGATDTAVNLNKDADPTRTGWSAAGYGDAGSQGLPNEAAHFTMVAVAVQNERAAQDALNLMVGVAAGGACVAVAGVVGAVALWPE